jgi:hypothetical protein
MDRIELMREIEVLDGVQLDEETPDLERVLETLYEAEPLETELHWVKRDVFRHGFAKIHLLAGNAQAMTAQREFANEAIAQQTVAMWSPVGEDGGRMDDKNTAFPWTMR